MNQHATVLLLLCGDAACGFVAAGRAGDDLELHKIGVLAEYRRQGLAAQLLQQAVVVQELPVRRCLIEVAENNAPARAFYHSTGFTEIYRREDYYADGSTAISMEKILCSP